jgi:hypothetical protein
MSITRVCDREARAAAFARSEERNGRQQSVAMGLSHGRIPAISESAVVLSSVGHETGVGQHQPQFVPSAAPPGRGRRRGILRRPLQEANGPQTMQVGAGGGIRVLPSMKSEGTVAQGISMRQEQSEESVPGYRLPAADGNCANEDAHFADINHE